MRVKRLKELLQRLDDMYDISELTVYCSNDILTLKKFQAGTDSESIRILLSVDQTTIPFSLVENKEFQSAPLSDLSTKRFTDILEDQKEEIDNKIPIDDDDVPF